MKKIAFFVEGFTEQLFLTKLFEEVCAKGSLAITSIKGKGGGKIAISFTAISAKAVTADTEYYVLIVDCSGENNLRSYINDRREGLIREGYEKIIGIRDVYPNFNRNEIAKLLQGLNYKLPQLPIRTEFILGVMEIEAWFLSEHTHFPRIHPNLNSVLISTSLNFNPETDDMELRDSPAQDLNAAYNLVGSDYNKEISTIERTINSIDYAQVFFNPKTNSVKALITELNSFVS